jgi:hypothetical protein
MKLTIDTKEDSAEEIKKVIHLLNMIIEGKTTTETYPPSSGSVLGDFFGSPSTTNTESTLNELPTNNSEEKKEEDDRMIIY